MPVGGRRALVEDPGRGVPALLDRPLEHAVGGPAGELRLLEGDEVDVGGDGSEHGNRVVGAGNGRPCVQERIEGMPRPTSAPPPGVTIGREDYGGDGPRFVVARAEAELVERYGFLDAGETGSPRPCSTRRPGPSWWPPRRRRRAARRRGRPARRRPDHRRGPAPLGRSRPAWARPRPGPHGGAGAGGRRPGSYDPAAGDGRPPARGGGPLRGTGWGRLSVESAASGFASTPL